jgi:phytol kinase
LSDFLGRVLPDLGTVAVVAPLALAVAVVAGALVARARTAGMRVAYTRKLFHFAIFTAAAAVHRLWDLPGTMVFGTIVALVVLAAVARGDGFPLYEAMARDSDRPRRSLFIVVPLVTTAVGGLAAALLAGPYAAVGYLAAGWGDAIGEPVGARWGRHPYRVPSLAGVPATRTWEGSAAVFVVASIGSGVALASIGAAPLWGALVCGLVAALVEGVSNHGLDNLTVQLVPSLVAAFLFGGAL